MLLRPLLHLQALSVLLPLLVVGVAGSADPGRFLQQVEGRGSAAQKKFLPDVAPILLPSEVRLRGQFNPGARPLGQLNDHHGFPSSSHHSTARTASVAVIIVGMLRQFLEPQVQSTQHFLTDTLAAEHGEIDLFICVDTPNAAQVRKLSVGRVMPRAVFEHSFEGRHNQWPRMAACLSDVQATVGAAWSDYTWVVRSRPDNVFFAPVPPLKPLRTDTVYTRVRRFGGYAAVDDETLSWWDYRGTGRTGAVCGADETGAACVMRDGGKPAPTSASCVLVDDQFAYIPRDLADTFFRTDAAPTAAFKGQNNKAANRGKLHYPVVQGHERCQWPEGQLTCRLLDAGARLEPLRVSFRIVAHTKLNNGNHPPQTGPRDTPHICEGKAAALPPVVDRWTKEDILVWIRQHVGLGGVAAALAGASLGRCVAVLILSPQSLHQRVVDVASHRSQLRMCIYIAREGGVTSGAGLPLLLSQPNELLFSESEREQLQEALRKWGRIAPQRKDGGG